MRWRPVDLKRVISERFGVQFHERYVGKLLKKLGFSHKSARPRQPPQDEQIIEAFKKNFSCTLSVHFEGLPETTPIRSGSRTKPGSVRRTARFGNGPSAECGPANPPISATTMPTYSEPSGHLAASARRSLCPTPTPRRCNSTSGTTGPPKLVAHTLRVLTRTLPIRAAFRTSGQTRMRWAPPLSSISAAAAFAPRRRRARRPSGPRDRQDVRSGSLRRSRSSRARTRARVATTAAAWPEGGVGSARKGYQA